MKRYKLEDLKIGMKVYIDELYDIEGVYIILKNPKVVQDVNNGDLVPSARSNCTTLPEQAYHSAG